MRIIHFFLLGLILAILSACGSSGSVGRVQVFVTSEDTVTEGIQPGTGRENILDGWTVQYQKYLVTIGNFRAWRSSKPTERLSDPRTYVVNLRTAPTTGFLLAEFQNVAAERWDKVAYDLPNATASTLCAAGTTPADCNFMKQNGYSLYFEATMTKTGGQSCRPGAPTDCVARESVTFRWGFRAGTSYEDCGPEEGDSGFAVPSGGVATVKPTIHGDHWVFTGFVHEEASRRAQWIADSDLNRDGETTLTELQQVQAADVFPSTQYNLSGGGTIVTAYDFALAQVKTIGHFQGDGECPTRNPTP
jgi:hypothetical protein